MKQVICAILPSLDDALVILILSVAWGVREIVSVFSRKKKGFGGFLYSIPPDEDKSALSTPRPPFRRKKRP